MRQVLKWDVPVDDEPHEIGGGLVTLVACQHSPEVVQVWTTEEMASIATSRRLVQVFGTGQPLPDITGDHVGSVVTANGALVWHVFSLMIRAE